MQKKEREHTHTHTNYTYTHTKGKGWLNLPWTKSEIILPYLKAVEEGWMMASSWFDDPLELVEGEALQVLSSVRPFPERIPLLKKGRWLNQRASWRERMILLLRRWHNWSMFSFHSTLEDNNSWINSYPAECIFKTHLQHSMYWAYENRHSLSLPYVQFCIWYAQWLLYFSTYWILWSELI